MAGKRPPLSGLAAQRRSRICAAARRMIRARIRTLSADRYPRPFGKYVLLRPLARGGMGEIYLAAGGEIGGFEKICVLKKVLTEKADPCRSNRFLDEAKVVIRLSHANLVSVFDAGQVDDEFYIAMEYVEGKNLREAWNRCAQRQTRFPLDVALYVVREVCR